jgi:AcrR family transcriptional regulator
MVHLDSSLATIGRPRNPDTAGVVVDAVLDLIGDGATLSSLSFVTIARQAGISRNSLYRRWESKEKLYLDVVRSIARTLPVVTQQSARENLVHILTSSFERIEDERVRRMDRAICAETLGFPDLYEYYLDNVVAPLMSSLKSEIRRGKETGEIRVDVDESLLSELLVAPVFARASSTDTGDLDSESSSQLIADVLFEGVAPN